MVLQRDDAPDELGRRRLHRLADGLERVAQPLRRDPQFMQGRHVGVGERGLERPGRLVRLPRHGRGSHPDRRRHVRADRPDAGARREDQRLVIEDEVGEPRRAQEVQQLVVACRSLCRPGVEKRRQREPLALRPSIPEDDKDPDLDVEVTDLPELVAESPQLPDMVADDRTLEPVAEDPPAGAGSVGRPRASRGPPRCRRRRSSPARERASGRGGSEGSSDLPRPTDRRRRPPGCVRSPAARRRLAPRPRRRCSAPPG